MIKALPPLLGAGFAVAACYAIGVLIMDRLRISGFLGRPERYPLGFLLGAGAVHLLMFLLLALHLAYWPVVILPLLGALILAVRSGAWKAQGLEFNPVSRSLYWTAGILTGIYLVVYFVIAWAPERSADGSGYHLGILARELRFHGFEKITTKFYAMLGQGVELVFLPAFVIGKHSAAALTHLCFAVALAFSIFCFGRRQGGPWIGAAAALLTFASPVFGQTASVAYVDPATAAIVFSTFYWLEIWDRQHGIHDQAWRLLIPVGLMAGYAFAAKFTAFTIGAYALGFVAIRARNMKLVTLVAACGLVMGGPWIVRNWIVYENPMAPMGNAIFRNPYTHVSFEDGFRQMLSRYDVADMRMLPWHLTVGGEKAQGLIGPVFLLLPLGLLALRTRAGRHIWIAALVVSSTYFSNIGARFLIPSLPFFSLSIAMAVGEIPMLLTILMVVHAILSWPGIAPYYSDRWAAQLDICLPNESLLCSKIPIRGALRIIDQNTFLMREKEGYAVARMIDQVVPPGETIFGIEGVPEAYTSREFRGSFESASNEVLTDIYNSSVFPILQPTRVLSFRFPERTGRHFRLLQTAKGEPKDQWNVHELRFLHKGIEIARRPEWRLQAWPLPADVQMAFDNSPVTRWRSWETPSPGMYIEVDLGRDETIDEIRSETSPDSDSVRLQPEVKNVSGVWEDLRAELTILNAPPPVNARRKATYELHRKGVNYILVYDRSYDAKDVNADPVAWGLVEVGAVPGQARLYKSIW